MADLVAGALVALAYIVWGFALGWLTRAWLGKRRAAAMMGAKDRRIETRLGNGSYGPQRPRPPYSRFHGC